MTELQPALSRTQSKLPPPKPPSFTKAFWQRQPQPRWIRCTSWAWRSSRYLFRCKGKLLQKDFKCNINRCENIAIMEKASTTSGSQLCWGNYLFIVPLKPLLRSRGLNVNVFKPSKMWSNANVSGASWWNIRPGAIPWEYWAWKEEKTEKIQHWPKKGRRRGHWGRLILT